MSGTLFWQAPEIIIISPSDLIPLSFKTKSSDVWAFGCTAFEVRTMSYRYKSRLIFLPSYCRIKHLMRIFRIAIVPRVAVTLNLSSLTPSREAFCLVTNKRCLHALVMFSMHVCVPTLPNVLECKRLSTCCNRFGCILCTVKRFVWVVCALLHF